MSNGKINITGLQFSLTKFEPGTCYSHQMNIFLLVLFKPNPLAHLSSLALLYISTTFTSHGQPENLPSHYYGTIPADIFP